MSRSRYRFGETEYAYFLTCTIVGWLPVFTRPETVQFLYDSWCLLQEKVLPRTKQLCYAGNQAICDRAILERGVP